MGEMADDVLEGLACEECGEYFEDVLQYGAQPPGYPRRCEACDPPKKVTRKKGKKH